jgi:hypothetical protein
LCLTLRLPRRLPRLDRRQHLWDLLATARFPFRHCHRFGVEAPMSKSPRI